MANDIDAAAKAVCLVIVALMNAAVLRVTFKGYCCLVKIMFWKRMFCHGLGPFKIFPYEEIFHLKLGEARAKVSCLPPITDAKSQHYLWNLSLSYFATGLRDNLHKPK